LKQTGGRFVEDVDFAVEVRLSNRVFNEPDMAISKEKTKNLLNKVFNSVIFVRVTKSWNVSGTSERICSSSC